MLRCFYFLLLLIAPAAFAQKGEWYTYSTGKAPLCHLTINDDELIVERMDPAFRQVKMMGQPGKDGEQEHLKIIKKVNANDRVYMIFLSADNLYFCTTLKYFRKQDSLQMFCADGADDGYKTQDEAVAAAKKDTGTHFSITLFRKEQLQEQKRHTPVAKITEAEFRDALQQFTQYMDQFWQYRGYGRYEPYHTWTNLIYGNAFAASFDPRFDKLSLNAKNLKTPIAQYGNDPAIKKLLQDAGLVEE
ncbi:hypothetical protein SAMN05518672_11041 [Chitinophaga sp. CF118]|uniref:hypothetical protein n=1 Tax=Chitinophaga sp. CF118 TaxID=1884367 RepID=UPI0008EAC37C|nr:hypothetical protein [Chitinophaga sp. CF118]SFE77384.1 hypothetical protein SAMN05518672_11041 [Chitinophaga sp. CF118]